MNPIAPHRLAALGLFRSSVFFVVAVGAFAERSQHTQTILLTVIFLLDVASWHMLQAIFVAADQTYNKVWGDTLSDRLFIERLFNEVRGGFGGKIDVEALRLETQKEAAADLLSFVKSNTLWAEWGWFKRAAMGAGHFAWYWISYAIFYGFAAFFGSAIRGL